jgi:type II secretory pathway pseudopilin PulG
MIEIAICLAVIGFALVAIIGVLPIGMNVQKDNRQETIINQDASVFLDAIRNGARGLDDLTNYVVAITNYAAFYNNGTPTAQVHGYTPTGATPGDPWLTNGFVIVGLLSTPKYTDVRPTTFLSNHIVAIVRSMSGPASEKFPQTNSTVQDLALSYKLISEVTPYGTNFYDPSSTNYSVQFTGGDTNLIVARSNYMRLVLEYSTNLHDLRLTFRWPLLPNYQTGPGRQIYRTMVSGYMVQTNVPNTPTNLFFFEPRYYVKAP